MVSIIHVALFNGCIYCFVRRPFKTNQNAACSARPRNLTAHNMCAMSGHNDHQLHFQFASTNDKRLSSLFCAEVLCHICSKQHMAGCSTECSGCIQQLNGIASAYTAWGTAITKRCEPSRWRAPEVEIEYAKNLQRGQTMATTTTFAVTDLVAAFHERMLLQFVQAPLLHLACVSFERRWLQYATDGEYNGAPVPV